MGLVLALGILYTALEWTSAKKDNEDENTSLNIADMEDALIINEQQQEQPEPEPEAPQEVVEVALPEEFKVVDDNKEVAKISIVSADQDRELPPPPVIVQPAQTVVEEPEDQIFEIVENPAVPPTGDIPSLLKWIASHIEYPQSALDNGVQGKVVLRFVVEKDGSIGDILVARKVDPARRQRGCSRA
ncbi:TonB-dependent receptor [Porphyromonas uenonis 60-3]|uniref:TonB-dependent receptor n=2 Tax=Porphyromonas uenonis TaxID=281920 RepID=C2MAX6_9PORP|nr:TonB-dependent receptor [Porphyromonas uenonis 60-3]